jgi:predicted DsbA family dithiol-disulfide isomerase
MNQTPDTVIIAHDYLCPWCWIGFFQAGKLAEEFPHIKQDWRGYELLPESLGPLPESKPAPAGPNIPEEAKPPSRMEMLLKHEGLSIPANRTIGVVRTHAPLEGAEYFKDKLPEKFDQYNEGVYRAFWQRSEDISDMAILGRIAQEAGADRADFAGAVSAKAYASKIVAYDDDPYADDITHVPTFMFRGERCAEAPYETIRDLAQRFVAWYGSK